MAADILAENAELTYKNMKPEDYVSQLESLSTEASRFCNLKLHVLFGFKGVFGCADIGPVFT